MMIHNIMLVEGNRLMLEQLSSVIKNTQGVELVARFREAGEALGQGIVFMPNIILLDADNSNIINLLT